MAVPAVVETRRRSLLRRLLRRPPAVIAAAVVAAFVIIAVGAPHVAPYDPIKQDFLAIRKPPSDAYRLGTDEVGRDILSRLIWGARASLLAGVIPVSIALVVSIPLGLCRAAPAAGSTRSSCGSPTPCWRSRSSSSPSRWRPSSAPASPTRCRHRHRRLAHVPAPGTRHRAGAHDRGVVESARSLGCSPVRIAVRHVLPNILPPLLIQSSLTAAAAIIAEASLSFLGLGPAAAGALVGQHAQRRPALSRAGALDGGLSRG